jgi:stalled ribosome alternative rescue factor ArfA
MAGRAIIFSADARISWQGNLMAGKRPKKNPKRRNVAAKALREKIFRPRRVKPLKGKGTYRRRPARVRDNDIG